MGNSASEFSEADVRQAMVQNLDRAAKLFYSNQTQEGKKEIEDFFKNLDANGDGKVSIQELRKGRKCKATSELFKMVGRDEKGYLDMEECKTLFYIIATKTICATCSRFILANGYKCIQCFNDDKSTDICLACFRSNSDTPCHLQKDFVDDNMLNALLQRPEFVNKEAFTEQIELVKVGPKAVGIVIPKTAWKIFYCLATGTAIAVDLMGTFGATSIAVQCIAASLSVAHR